MARKKKKPIAPRRRPWGWLLAIAVLAPALAAAVIYLGPDTAALAVIPPKSTAFIDRRKEQNQGRLAVRRKWRPLSSISKFLQQAVLIAEDDKFFRHNGFDWDMIFQAAERNLEAGQIRYGASTISQQLAKNLYLSPERSFLRKAQEMLLTLRLEHDLDKRRILELYLNLVEWGPGVFGAEAAARHWFGVSAARLSARQAARLAATLPAPLRYNPARPSPYLAKRTRRILREMRKRGLGNIWR